MMKRFFWGVISLCLLSACSNSSLVEGLALDANLQVMPYQVVRLISVDDQGEETAEWQVGMTDGSGKMSLYRPSHVDGRQLLEVISSDGSTMRGFVSGTRSNVLVSPWTHALVSALIQLTETQGGLSLEDYSDEELKNIGMALSVAAENSEEDLTNQTSLVNTVFSLVGDEILDSELAEQIAEPIEDYGATDVETAGPTFDAPEISDPCQEDHVDLTGLYFTLDVQANGSICKGHYQLAQPGYRLRGFELSLPDEVFSGSGSSVFPEVSGENVKWEDEDELRLGPVQTVSGNFQVSRKIWVPETEEYFRYLEVVKNLSTESKETTILITSCLGSENNTVLLGDESLTVSDDFSITSDDGGIIPSVVTLWQNDASPMDVDSADLTVDLSDPDGCIGKLEYEWSDVSFSAGETKTFMHFGLLSSRKDPEVLASKISTVHTSPPTTYLSALELSGMQSLSLRSGNVRGEAGSFLPNISLTVLNETQNKTHVISTQSDGSFYLFIEADEGDTLVLTPETGTARTMTVSSS